MFGRETEFEQARAALEVAAAGMPQVLLVGGDAGIGKTTLTAAIADEAGGRGFTVAVGHCLDIDDGVALRPVREALRQAISGRKDDELSPVTRRLAPYLRGESDSASVDELSLVVDELAVAEPLLVALEDLHWADRSTIDFATAVSRTGRGRVCLVLTFRTDEVSGRHPFFKSLTEVGRSPGAHRIDLGALASGAIAGILASQGLDDLGLTREVVARSEGNPLYAEELLAAGPDRLPEQLGALLLARVDALSDTTRRLLRLASAHGSRLDLELLAHATGLDAAAVDAGLREALAANVVRLVGSHVDFRHGLLREAVYGDLMPGERAQAHRLLAEAAEERAGADTSLADLGALAFHWYAAHDLPRAYQASQRAGLAAHKLGLPEGISHLELALELYDRVPHDGRPLRSELLAVLALLHRRCAEYDRGRVVIAQALDALAETSDPRVIARVYTTYVYTDFVLEGYVGQEEALDLAVAGLGDELTEDLADALSVRAELLMRLERLSEGEELAPRVVELGRALGLPAVEATGWWVRAVCSLGRGRPDDAADHFHAAADIARRGGEVHRAYQHEVERLIELVSGVDTHRGVELADELWREATAAGYPRSGRKAACRVVAGLVNLGRLDAAGRVVEALRSTGPLDDIDSGGAHVGLMLARGDDSSALEADRRRMILVRQFAAFPNSEEILLHVRVLIANGLVDEALKVADEYSSWVERSDFPIVLGVLAHVLCLSLDASQAQGRPPDPELLGRGDRLLSRAVVGLVDSLVGWEHGVSVLSAKALRADLHGEPAAQAWRAAYDAAVQVGDGFALPVRLRLVAALLAEGERDEARTALPEVVADAKAMGMNGVLADAVKLGRRHRIPVPGDARPSKLDILTAREREVLDVLATGATNKAIAERLFISEKTVSVHVTNLLAKLGATNRTEAAALARELAPAD
jgi:DNA-binding CsgD family transcriptional regulator